MGFSNNYAAAQNINSLKPAGDYEVVITKIEERTTKNGATGLNLSLVIRNDIPSQQYKNAYLFYTLWKRKEPTPDDLSVNGYGFGQIMTLGKAAGLPDGKEYANLEEYLKELMGKPLKVTVKHTIYNGVEREEISSLKNTDFPDCKHIMKQSQTQTANGFAKAPQQTTYANTISDSTQSISADEDLPF